MEILQLLKQLKSDNIDISLHGKDLEINYDDRELPPTILAEIRQHKDAIINFLEQLDMDRQITDAIPLAPESKGYITSSSQRSLWVLCQFEDSNKIGRAHV